MTGTQTAKRRKAERRGHLSETAAATLLRAKMFRILERRAKTVCGEIDIVARRGRVIAFVEVKARDKHDDAVSAVTASQARRIVRAAHAWLAANQAFNGHDCRFDIVTVSPYLWPRHLPNAFNGDV
jgi:putative endonuclease